MSKDTFAERLHSTMEACGMTQAELARRSGVRASAISRYLTGITPHPSAAKLAALAKALNTTADALMYAVPAESREDLQDVLRQVINIADRALIAADIVRDDLTRPSYTDEYTALAVCYGELAGLVRLIRDVARCGMVPPR